MSLIILLPLLVCIIGVLLYALTADKMAEIGRIMFFCGLLVSLAVFGQHYLRLT